MGVTNTIAIVVFLLITFSAPTYFTKRKWNSEKEFGASGVAFGEYARMWFWIWIGTASAFGGLVALVFKL